MKNRVQHMRNLALKQSNLDPNDPGAIAAAAAVSNGYVVVDLNKSLP